MELEKFRMDCGGQGDNSVDKVLALKSYEVYQYKINEKLVYQVEEMAWI